MIYLFLIIIFVLEKLTFSLNNKIIGVPEVECTPQEITVWFSTLKIFKGKIYSIGYKNDSECIGKHTGIKITFIHIKRNSCGMIVEKEAITNNWKFSIKLTVSFNPHFTTKADHSYLVTCRFKFMPKVNLPVTTKPSYPKISNGILACSYKIVNKTLGTHQYIWKCPEPLNFGICLRLTNCKVKNKISNKIVGTINSFGCASNNKYSLDYSQVNLLKITKIVSKKIFIENCNLELRKKKNNSCPLPVC
ncbi:Zona pellucida domain-containing protein [Strongyloides ratti]|uniref:Zona pellucida domain-containing protein n=1 Tax=Strongyloides ratti TaxID=34506 RepID=A0A090L7H8_STRRB|nr:Zona pellucida domain-containing protein [Strongyloides ratti]CEF65677.1 Zona pellucida domain-containing protein [Strongyloides ratti]